MEGLRKGSLFPFLETGRGECLASRLPPHRGSPGQGDFLPDQAACPHMASGEGAHPCPGYVSTRPVSFPFADFACFPRADGLSAPARRTLRHAGTSGGAGGHAAHVAPETAAAPAVEQPCFASMVRRSGARSLTCRPGCPGGTGTGMTRERPGKSGFSGREQKKHCLLLRLGIWTFDCVREVAAWGR